MRVGIIGGGIAGLSAAFYMKKFGLPITEILIYESSSRLGGWIDSKKVTSNKDVVYFEKGPRTLRLSTGELKELNSMQMALDLDLSSKIDLIPKSHLAAKNRFIYYENNICPVRMSLFKKNPLLSKRLISYGWHELRTPARSPTVEDESVWSFIARRFDPMIADNLVDPLFKGICGGDIKYLSASCLLKHFYDYEIKYGSVIKGIVKGFQEVKGDESGFEDLAAMRDSFMDQSVWRVKTGMNELVKQLKKNLQKHDVKFLMNEPVNELKFEKDHVLIDSKCNKREVDFVISSIYSKNLAHLIPNEYLKLQSLLKKIDAISMAVVNFYFKKDVLPVQGFGYLVPTNQNSAILGCIFDSVFNKEGEENTVLTVMIGGAWYDQYVANKTNDEIYRLAYGEIKSHLHLDTEPDYHEVSLLKDCIPQYKVGHKKIIAEIKEELSEQKLDERLYLTGQSYEGVGLNDVIFNARKLVQNTLPKNQLIKTKLT